MAPVKIGPSEIATHERIPSLEELALVPTVGRVTVKLNGVTWPDGSPVALTLRALSFAERAAAYRESVEVGKRISSGYTEEQAWALAVVRRGLVEPAISDSQVNVLANLNARIIDDLVDTIDRLGNLDPRLITAAVEALAGVPTPEPVAAPGAAPSGGTNAEPASDAGPAVRAARGDRGKRAA